MKKIYINPGHSDVDPGAVAYETERVLNVKVANFMNEYLLANYICETMMTPGSDNGLSSVANAANEWGADFFVSIHFNAAGGDGWEGLVYSEDRVPIGKIFEKYVKAIGQNSRGVKLRPGLAVLRLTDMPAILNEGAFVDNLTDITDWNEDHELKEMGIAYAKATAEYLNLEKKDVVAVPDTENKPDSNPENETTEQKTLYRVRKSWDDVKSQVGAYRELDNAKETCDNAGKEYSVYDEQGNVVYPIRETTTPEPETKTLYRVRKSWDDVKSQTGAYYNLDSAKQICDESGSEYSVYDEQGNVVYPIRETTESETPTVKKKLYRVRKSAHDAKTQTGAFTILENAIERCQESGEEYHVFDWEFNLVYSYKAPEKVEDSDVSEAPINPTPEPETPTEPTPAPVEPEKPVEEKPEPITPVYDLDYPEKNKIVDKNTNQDEAQLKGNCTKAITKILMNNINFDVEIAKAFFKLAPKYGIDPMMAISQSILETGWFNYKGSAVKPEQHNYCGLGVTSNGVTGAMFDTIEDGVRAQLQHLYAYGCKDDLPEGEETILDPRFKYVTRDIAPYWQNLAGRWAVPGYDKNTYSTPKDAMNAGNTYGQKIRTIYKSLEEIEIDDEDINEYFPAEIEPEIPNEEKPVEPEVTPDIPEVPSESTEPTPEPEIPNEEKPVEPEVTPDKDDEPINPDNGMTNEQVDELASIISKIIKKIIELIIKIFKK